MLANGVHIKQIQEWLGHSNFSTTADVYSHLDFSSKVQSGAVIANTLEMKKESKEASKVQEDINLIKSVKKNMKELGFENITDYFAYLDSVEEQNDEQNME